MKLICNNLEELPFIAKKCIDFFEDKKIIAFYGSMGVGKTTLIKAICEVSGVMDDPTSPTFSIVNEYKTNTNEIIYHFDFYRIKNEEEAMDMGYEEYFYSKNRCFIEWPEKISNLLPQDLVKVQLDLEGSNRLIQLTK